MTATNTTHPALKTRATELFGVDYPIVQTGMGWVSGPELTAATANAGGLGILSAVLTDTDDLPAQIDEVIKRTDKPFGVNLSAAHPQIDKRCQILIDKGVKVASFALAPKPEVIAKLKEAGLVVVPSIGAKRHAEKVAQWGADAVIVQGGEGGGHTGAVPTSLLLPQVVDAVDIPVIGAGGFFDGRGLVAALAYGAEGIAMGTRFLLTSDSQIDPKIKQLYLEQSVNDTVVTKEVDGVPNRVLNVGQVDKILSSSGVRRLSRAAANAVKFQRMSGRPWGEMIREGLEMKKAQELSWSQVMMAANAPMLYKAGLIDGNTDIGVLATGQVVGMIDDLPSCQELIDRIIIEATNVLSDFS